MHQAGVSVGADTEQSSTKCNNGIIPTDAEDINRFEENYDEWEREMQRMMSPSYLKAVTMSTLYDTVFEAKVPLIEGLLNRGVYLFVGSPRVGKSFMMAQFAYHISTGALLWSYKVRKSPVLYLALEDDYARLQQRLYQMFGDKEAEDLYLATSSADYSYANDYDIVARLKNLADSNKVTILIVHHTRKQTAEISRIRGSTLSVIWTV